MKKKIKYLFYLLLILVVSITLRLAIGEPCRVSSESMCPTILPGDWLWIDKATYGGKLPACWADIPLVNVFTWIPALRNADVGNQWKHRRIPGIKKPQINDLIVFQSPDGNGALLVKRIRMMLSQNDSIEITAENIYFQTK